MTEQGEQGKEAEELRAPEVVKPLSARKEEARRDRDVQKAHATKPQQVRPVENNVHTAKKPSAQAASPKQPKKPVPSPRLATPPPLRADSRPKQPSPPRNEAAKPASRSGAWVAIPIVAGVLLLLWYAGSAQSPPASNSSRPSFADRPQTTQPIPSQRTPTVSGPVTSHTRVGAAAPRAGVSAGSTQRVLPKTGSVRLSAYTATTGGERRAITGNAKIEMRHAVSHFATSTNTTIPCQWRSVLTGDHRLTLSVPGYRPSTTNVAVMPDRMSEVAVAMHPLPARVRFVFPATNVVFDVWNDTQRLGDSRTDWNLTPFVPHYLTFKANGWRTKRVKVQLAEPGKQYRCAIDLEKVASGLAVRLRARRGEPPSTGMMSVNGSKPIQVTFPLERNDLPVSGPLTLAVSIDGYNVLNSTQQVVLVDREMAEVTFEVERKSWISRTFGSSSRPTERVTTETEP